RFRACPPAQPGSSAPARSRASRSRPAGPGLAAPERSSLPPRLDQRALLGVEDVAQTVTEEVERQHGHEDGGTREHAHPPGLAEEALRVVEHAAPRGR